MNIAAIKKNDIANGLGCREVVFVAGCDMHCPGCFNPSAWDFHAGREFTPELLDEILDDMAPDHVAGLSVLGGEPMHKRNVQGVETLCRAVKKCYPNKDIWVYTGYYADVLISCAQMGEEPLRNLLCTDKPLVDVLVDGPFDEELHDITLNFRGSTNQRLIDVAATQRENRWDDPILLPL